MYESDKTAVSQTMLFLKIHNSELLQPLIFNILVKKKLGSEIPYKTDIPTAATIIIIERNKTKRRNIPNPRFA